MSEELNIKTLEELRANLDAEVSKYNDALGANDATAIASADKRVKDATKNYNEMACREAMAKLRDAEDPVMEIATVYTYDGLKPVINREDGNVTGMTVEPAKKQFDIVKFFKFCNMHASFGAKVENLNYRATVKAAKELKMPEEAIREITRNYKISDDAKKSEIGYDPASKSQIKTCLQKIIGDVMPGKTVDTSDVMYIVMTLVKRSKEGCGITAAKSTYMASLVFDVMHRLATGCDYGIEYKKRKTPRDAEDVSMIESSLDAYYAALKSI